MNKTKMTKKGLSDVVTTVLIILLVLAAVVIVWQFVQPMLTKTGGEISMKSKCIPLDVQALSCTNSSFTAYTIGFQNFGKANKMRAILINADGSQVTADNPAPGASGTQAVTALAGGPGKSATVAGILLNADGTDYVCDSVVPTVACKTV